MMQNCDVSQHDWHSGQILCILHTAPTSSGILGHAGLIDFSATTQTLDDLEIDYSADDYGKCVSAITHKRVTGLDPKWVFAQWDRDDMKREIWDTNSVGMSKGGAHWRSATVDPYKFVYESI